MQVMRRGDFEAAWRATDALEAPRRAGRPREAHHLVWDGTPVDGRVVRVRCLHGLGDTLQFMRFVPLLQRRARRLHFLVQPALLDLLQGLPGLGEVSTAWTDDPPAAELEVEVMELAYLFRCEARDLPPPYAGFILRARGALPDLRDPAAQHHVALLWAASSWDSTRSLRLEQLAPLFGRPGTRFYSLQQEAAARDPGIERHGIKALSPLTASPLHAAAAMLQMDLVIAVDGMPAHLSGTLGRPTWLLLKHEADWRWMEGRHDSPWYPSIRLFRQPRPGDWDGAIAQVADALDALTPAVHSAG